MIMHKLLIITGGYGSGKTECALALATRWATAGPVTLVDLDFVNPYFRAQDHQVTLARLGITLLAPDARVAALDAPSLPPATRQALLQPSGQTIVDLGGDPAGAVVIRQFAGDLQPAASAAPGGYDLWAVLNGFRPTTSEPAPAAALLREITAATGLRLTGLVSNTHLGARTTAEDIVEGLALARATAALLAVPLVLVGVPAWLTCPALDVPVLPITPRLRRPWDA